MFRGKGDILAAVFGEEEYKVKVKEFVFIVEIEDLGGAKRLESIAPVRSITKI